MFHLKSPTYIDHHLHVHAYHQNINGQVSLFFSYQYLWLALSYYSWISFSFTVNPLLTELFWPSTSNLTHIPLVFSEIQVFWTDDNFQAKPTSHAHTRLRAPMVFWEFPIASLHRDAESQVKSLLTGCQELQLHSSLILHHLFGAAKAAVLDPWRHWWCILQNQNGFSQSAVDKMCIPGWVAFPGQVNADNRTLSFWCSGRRCRSHTDGPHLKNRQATLLVPWFPFPILSPL